MEPDRDDDALLVAAADDPEAFAQFYRAHVRGLIAYFRRRVGSAELAADLRPRPSPPRWRGAGASRPSGARRPRGCTASRGASSRPSGAAATSSARARRRLGMARIELTDEMLERVEALADAELARVDVALAALPDDQRAAVHARIVEDHDYDEIATAQQISEPAARQRVSRGLAALRAHMTRQEP
jgi:RNA polymerase sigma-70 factor, ECF subfamily